MTSSFRHGFPEFFCVFLQDCCLDQLPISSAFSTTHFESDAPDRRATIKRPGTDQEWIVEVAKKNDDYYFRQGWEKVVQDCSLKHGDFMVFQYRGNSVFAVRMYGKHACLKESVMEGEEIADVELVDDYEESNEVVNKRARAGRPSVENPNSEAVKAAKFYMKIHSDYPSFRIVIAPGYLQLAILNIPMQFVDAHFNGREKRFLELQVMDRIWVVTMLVYRQPSPNCKLTKGVPAFIDANNIQEGDVLVFELVKPDTFKVSIFPC